MAPRGPFDLIRTLLVTSIADGMPETAQARRLGHHLDNRVVETYSHVAPELERRLLRGLERRWHAALAATQSIPRRPDRGISRVA